MARPRSSTAAAEEMPVLPEDEVASIDEESEKKKRYQKHFDCSASSCFSSNTKMALCFGLVFVGAGATLLLKQSYDAIYSGC